MFCRVDDRLRLRQTGIGECTEDHVHAEKSKCTVVNSPCLCPGFILPAGHECIFWTRICCRLEHVISKVYRRWSAMNINSRIWLTALQKPVKMSEKRDWDSLDVVSKWLIATRATVTQLTLMAGVIAGLLAYRDGVFDWIPWLAMTLGIYFAHSAENLVNDYIDYTRGIDEDNYYRSQYGIHPLVHKFWTKADWRRWFFTASLVAVLCGIFVLFYTNFSPLVIGLFLFGIAILPTYAWPLKYWGLGEILIFINWGMVLIPGIYSILAGGIPSNLALIVMAGMAFGFGFGSFNWGKHID